MRPVWYLWKTLSGPLVFNGINNRTVALGHIMESLEGEWRPLSPAKLGFPV